MSCRTGVAGLLSLLVRRVETGVIASHPEVMTTPLKPLTESFTAEFVARLAGSFVALVELSSSSSHPEAFYASGAFDRVIHSRICRTVHRTLKPDTPMEPLLESFTREFVQQFIAP